MYTQSISCIDTARKLLLRKMRKVNRQVENPNFGGCGIIAYAGFKFLKQVMSPEAFVDHNVRVVYMQRIGDEEMNTEINEDNQGDFVSNSCSHAVLQIGQQYFDSNGENHETGGYSVHTHITSEEYLLRSINPSLYNDDESCAIWNSDFCRATEVPKIEEIFGFKLEIQ